MNRLIPITIALMALAGCGSSGGGGSSSPALAPVTDTNKPAVEYTTFGLPVGRYTYAGDIHSKYEEGATFTITANFHCWTGHFTGSFQDGTDRPRTLDIKPDGSFQSHVEYRTKLNVRHHELEPYRIITDGQFQGQRVTGLYYNSPFDGEVTDGGADE